MKIHFAFVGEGPSDAGLSEKLEDLCLRFGATEAAGVALDLRLTSLPSRTVEEKIEATLQLEPDADIVFVHRDADSRDPQPRRAEIQDAVQQIDMDKPCVPVIPVQETEAWLLLDENAIRYVAENPNSRVPLDLPTATRVESIANPKERLKDILIHASELSGRRLERFKKRFPQHRRRLLDLLEIDGPVSSVPAWQAMCNDVNSTLNQLREIRSAGANEP